MSKTSQVEISDMDKFIMAALYKYGDEAAKAIGETLPLVGKETVDELKATSPKRTGAYARSWAYKMMKGGLKRSEKYNNKLVVYNKKYYRIVHLLEKEHAKRGGGRYYPDQASHGSTVHVKPAQDKAEKTAFERIKDKLGRIGV